MTRTRLIAVACTFGAALVIGAVLAIVYGGDGHKLITLPRCARLTHTIRPPGRFPSSFPLPPGTAFATLSTAPGGFLILEGRAPLDLVPVARFFVRELPPAGFTLGAGDSETGYEAESDFSGHGVRGRFKVRVLPACRGAVVLLVVLAPR